MQMRLLMVYGEPVKLTQLSNYLSVLGRNHPCQKWASNENYAPCEPQSLRSGWEPQQRRQQQVSTPCLRVGPTVFVTA